MARIEREFYKLVDLPKVATKVQLSLDVVDFVYRYWLLKRRAGKNKPLLPPRGEEEGGLASLSTEDTERDKMKMLVGIRQVRHLLYLTPLFIFYRKNCTFWPILRLAVRNGVVHILQKK
jgi:hypothetical protein